ncbi:hypothetical protein ACWD4O_43980 [Streptomyces sp. NPDC002623]
MSTDALTRILRFGGTFNLIGSPLSAVFFHWWDVQHDRVGVGIFPVWIYSFFYCTCILGLFYIQASRDPAKYRSFIGVAVIAKVWGITACLYAVFGEYYWMLLLGFYDVAFGVLFFVLYRQLGTTSAANAREAR